MFYALALTLIDKFSFLNLFRYLTFRTGGAILTALLINFLIGPCIIKWLKKHQKNGQPIRLDGPASHLAKKRGTPTMGGVMILGSLIVSSLLWANLSNAFIWIVLCVTFLYGVLGAVDDWLKLSRSSSAGLSAKCKMCMQAIVAFGMCCVITQYHTAHLSGYLAVPFFKNVLLDFGVFYMPFCLCVIVGASNAVNLTDGLDGLAIVPVMVVAGCFALIAYLAGNIIFANYLQIHFISGSGELAVICGAILGAGLGFLWFNAPPAQVFMGDIGSLSLGGLLGTIAVIIKHEIVLAIIGGVFVVESISVIVQVTYFKLTGKRIFLMAPIHHHFEKLGWPEPTIVIRFWVIAFILGLVGLSSLKLR